MLIGADRVQEQAFAAARAQRGSSDTWRNPFAAESVRGLPTGFPAAPSVGATDDRASLQV